MPPSFHCPIASLHCHQSDAISLVENALRCERGGGVYGQAALPTCVAACTCAPAKPMMYEIALFPPHPLTS